MFVGLLVVKLICLLLLWNFKFVSGNDVNYPARFYGQNYRSKESTQKRIHLTFDDGPNPKTLASILPVLRKYGIKATFFMGGRVLEKNADEMKDTIVQLLKDGHWMGSHTYGHEHLIHLNETQIKNQVVKAEEVFQTLTGKRPYIIREPYGESGTSIDKILSEMDYVSIRWNMDTNDWRCENAECVVRNIEILLARNTGGILLMHEYQHSMEALEKIILNIIAAGFQFSSLTEYFDADTKIKLYNNYDCDKVDSIENLYFEMCSQLKSFAPGDLSGIQNQISNLQVLVKSVVKSNNGISLDEMEKVITQFRSDLSQRDEISDLLSELQKKASLQKSYQQNLNNLGTNIKQLQNEIVRIHSAQNQQMHTISSTNESIHHLIIIVVFMYLFSCVAALIYCLYRRKSNRQIRYSAYPVV